MLGRKDKLLLLSKVYVFLWSIVLFIYNICSALDINKHTLVKSYTVGCLTSFLKAQSIHQCGQVKNR